MASHANTFARKQPENASDLSEMDLAKVVGGFNPQPDPPAERVSQVRVMPVDFGIRTRQIGN